MSYGDPERLRLFFFSDWRLQPLELVEATLEEAGPVGLIVYGGDEVRRFKPAPVVTEAVVSGVARQGLNWTIPPWIPGAWRVPRAGDLRRLRRRDLTHLTTSRADKAVAVVGEMLGRPPLRELPVRHSGVYSLGEILELFERLEESNWLHKLAGAARCGSILGE